jgi:hypothetical protein
LVVVTGGVLVFLDPVTPCGEIAYWSAKQTGVWLGKLGLLGVRLVVVVQLATALAG